MNDEQFEKILKVLGEINENIKKLHPEYVDKNAPMSDLEKNIYWANDIPFPQGDEQEPS